jgi:hypothetical protein
MDMPVGGEHGWIIAPRPADARIAAARPPGRPRPNPWSAGDGGGRSTVLRMLEQFSDTARRVVALAEEEADRMGHPHIGTEHLLLGLLDEDGTAAATLLAAAGATLVAARDKVVEAVGPIGPVPGPGQLLRTARAQRALDRAARFSRAGGEPQVRPEDILAGVLDVEGRAGQVLRGLGVDVSALGEAVKRSRTGAAAGPSPAPVAAPVPKTAPARLTAPAVASAQKATAPPGPNCPHCGADLTAGLSRRTVASPVGAETAAIVLFCPACGAVIGAAPA